MRAAGVLEKGRMFDMTDIQNVRNRVPKSFMKYMLSAVYRVTQIYFYARPYTFCGPGSSVGIATDYGLDGPEIESRWGQDFSHTSRPALGPTQPPEQWVPGLSRG
jgi:hypothetical protein